MNGAASRTLALAALTLVAAACSVPIQGAGNFETELDPEGHRTFAWDESRDREAGDDRLAENPFFEDRLHRAIETELLWRGIRHDSNDPDIRVHHHTTIRDHVLVPRSVEEEDGAGYEGPEVYAQREGVVVVHLIDADTGEDLWVGWAQGELESAFVGPAAMSRWIRDIVSTMFEDWPGPRSRPVE